MVICAVLSRVTIVITSIRGLRTLVLTTHEPPSKGHTNLNAHLRLKVWSCKGARANPKPYTPKP